MDNSTHNTSELLVQYLDGELSGSEKDDLEMQLKVDASLKAELESLQLAREAVGLYGLKQQVSAVHQQMMNELQAPVVKINPARRIVRYSMAIAASVLLIFLSITAYIFFTLSPDKLFADNYHSFELSTTRGGNEAEPTAIEKAYREKNYKEVTDLTTKWSEPDIRDEFLAGISSLELNKSSEAIHFFNGVIKLNETRDKPIYKDETEYYLALSYLKNKDYDLALELMNKIHNDPDHLYHKKITNKLILRVKMLKWR